jgi:hypothetical protein
MKTAQIGALQIGIIVLTVITAAIHLWLGITDGLMLFILNGIGYIVLVAALYLPQLKQYHSWVRWALIAFAAVTVLAWVAIGMRTPVAYFDKLVEILLIALLVIESRQR